MSQGILEAVRAAQETLDFPGERLRLGQPHKQSPVSKYIQRH
jgi:hypothetical protein